MNKHKEETYTYDVTVTLAATITLTLPEDSNQDDRIPDAIAECREHGEVIEYTSICKKKRD